MFKQFLLAVLLVAGFIGSWFCVSTVLANERANSSYYIDVFGRMDGDQYPLVARADGIFEQLKRVANNASVGAELILINTASRPWAIALADGNVVLSRGALEIIYGSAAEDDGDAWLAFVLGHELAHLGSRDLWQQHVFASLSALPDLENSALSDLQQAMTQSAFDAEAWRERELKADELGYVMAALAGFEVQKIFGDQNTKNDFLAIWEAATGSIGDTHYGASVRTEFLRVRLNASNHRLDQFQLGLMLAHTGRLADALTIFEDFQRYYSSSAVLSNLGYVYLQLAREAMPSQLAYRFWLPTLLQPDSGLHIPSRSFSSALNEKSLDHLQNAVRYLEQAFAMDPADIVISSNLAVAYHYLGRYFRARSVVEESIEHHPKSNTLLILRSIILVDQEPEIDMWPRATQVLQTLDSRDSPSLPVLFNLARLYQERERYGKAKEYWRRLNERALELPPAYRYQVCLSLEIECSADRGGQATNSLVLASQPQYPVRLGDSLQDEHLQKLMSPGNLTHWQVQEITGSTLKIRNVTAYFFDGVVELVRDVSPRQSIVSELISQYTPSVSGMLGSDRVLQFANGMSLLQRDGQFHELWIMH